MRGFRVHRRRFAALSLASVVGTVVLVAASPASAEDTDVAFSTRGVLGISGNSFEIVVDPPVPATVTPTGWVTIAAGDFVFRDDGDLFDPLTHFPINDVDVYATTDFVGAVDPAAGTFSLAGEAIASFSGVGFSDCSTPPMPVWLTTDPNSPDARAYNPADGTARLVAHLTVPETASDSSGCSSVNARLQLPTAPDAATLVLEVRVDPPLVPLPGNPPPTDPTAPPSSGTPPVVSPGAVTPGAATPGTTRASPKTSPPKKSSTTQAAGTAAGNTSTTAYVWRGGDYESDDDLVASPPAAAGPRPPAAPQQAARIGEAGDNSFGPGIVVIVLGSLLGAIALLRSEARRLFRRRERAAF